METFEIRYFLVAAELENITAAATKLSVSTPAVSRAISRLEDELGVHLFTRVGRNIKLSAEGKILQRDASRAITLLEGVHSQLRLSSTSIPIFLCGTEFGISAFLPEVVRRLKRERLNFELEVKIMTDTKLVERAVFDGEAHLGIVSGTTVSNQLAKISLGDLESRTLVGPGHSLYKFAESKQVLDIKEVLKYEFVSFPRSIAGRSLAYTTSGDGWRDDKFPRKITLKTESIEVAMTAIASGHFLGYLPKGLISSTSVLALQVSGCPYSSKSESFLLAKNPHEVSWMNKIFKSK